MKNNMWIIMSVVLAFILVTSISMVALSQQKAAGPMAIGEGPFGGGCLEDCERLCKIGDTGTIDLACFNACINNCEPILPKPGCTTILPAHIVE